MPVSTDLVESQISFSKSVTIRAAQKDAFDAAFAVAVFRILSVNHI